MMAVKGFLMVGIQCKIMLLAFRSHSLSWFAFARSLNVAVAPLLTGTKYPENNIPD